MTQDERNVLIGAFSRKAVSDSLLSLVQDRLDANEIAGKLDGDIMKDVPVLYTKRGAIEELRIIRNRIIELRKIAAEETGQDQV